MSNAYVIDKNMGHKMDVPDGVMPTHNADGQAVVPLTEEQKYLFSARGWLLISSVLSEDEVEEMRAYALRLHDDPESLPEHEYSFRGPLRGSPTIPWSLVSSTNFSPFPTFLAPIATAFAWRAAACALPPPRRANRARLARTTATGSFALPSTHTTTSACPARRFPASPA